MLRRDTDSGIEFLSRLTKKNYPPHLKKILLTGQASHHDTIEAINSAHIDYYIEKPWKSKTLQNVCRRLLTEYFVGHMGRTGDGHLVQPTFAPDNDRPLHAQPHQHLGDHPGQGGREHAGQLHVCACRIGEQTQDIKNGADAL